MKKTRICTIIVLLAFLISIDPAPAFCEAADNGENISSEIELPPLYFYALNVGYKDANSSQNYDFFELRKSTSEELLLDDYKVVYTNSSGNESAPLSFSEGSKLQGDSLVLGYTKSPQYSEAPAQYLYSLSSSGLASTSGKLSLYFENNLEDEICWGKISCDKQIAKFITTEDGNVSYVFEDGELLARKYYPEINSVAIHKEVQDSSCSGLRINEVYSFFEESASEQFVELYNSGADCNLDNLALRYKNKDYTLEGNISSGAYLAYQNEALVLTKNPTTQNTLELVEGENVLDSVSYPHGQKAGLSYSLIDSEWKLSYARTPGTANIFQEFQTCPEGKEINPETGNCVNISEVTETICPEGKYLNPATGRCKTIEEDDLVECAEGYERNPETNRCRKIQSTDASEYPVKTSAESSYSVPRRFAAYGLLILAIIAGLTYLVIQFRFEIGKLFRVLIAKPKNLFSYRKRFKQI